MNRLFLLLVAAGMNLAFTACGSSDDEQLTPPGEAENPSTGSFEENGYVDGAIVKATSDSKSHDDVYLFFKKELPPTSMSYMANPFLFGDEPDVCQVVNSYDELWAIYKGSEPLPIIDFDSYTLLVGKKETSQFSERLSRQSFYEDNGTYFLDIYYSGDLFFQTIVSVYYWGLYPKLDERLINVSVFFEQVNE